MARDFSSPKYQQIAAFWAEEIDKGKYADGYQLPTRPEFEKDWGVSRQVVRDALALLHTEGYVRSEPSKGTFVNRPPKISLPMWSFEDDDREKDSFVALVEDQGHEAAQDIVVESTSSSDPDLPKKVQFESDDLIVARRRRRYVNGVPYAVSDSFYPESLVRGSQIARPGDIERGARHVLRELGAPMHHHADSIASRRPHLREVEILKIAPGLPVIAHTRVSYTEAGRPVRVLASVLPSDRWELTYEVGR